MLRVWTVGGAGPGWLALGCCSYAMPLWLNQRGCYWLGRATTLATACVMTTSITVVLGPESNVPVTLLMLACWPFALFDAQPELGSVLTLCAIPTLGFVLVTSGVAVGLMMVKLSLKRPSAYSLKRSSDEAKPKSGRT